MYLHLLMLDTRHKCKATVCMLLFIIIFAVFSFMHVYICRHISFASNWSMELKALYSVMLSVPTPTIVVDSQLRIHTHTHTYTYTTHNVY